MITTSGLAWKQPFFKKSVTDYWFMLFLKSKINGTNLFTETIKKVAESFVLKLN